MNDTPIANNLEVKRSEEGKWLHLLPKELVGILPEGVWTTLTLDQKKDILRQNNILDKYLGPKPQEQIVQSSQTPLEADEAVKEVSAPTVEKINEVSDESREFAKAVSEVKEKESLEEVKPEQPQVSAEEKARIAEETASHANTQTFTLFGYQVDDNVARNSKEISETGEVEDGKTWAATLIKKIFAILSE
ncbi:MAG: hypothetical protein UT34_C0001G0482 [candidate division WS6 bacterium GW2011_GWF2_39_15]|uniref:Uncharacterized protein n=1 Tax=candidate division WS6 bacterium GW2011_GWF2_39_15 TaxID=1619100 RepID=A0A0G0N0R8_9BACT|nr:MAG: hypothetical protein UT34_C0001G0482 [candidate division WS6 bacterium GW2011_GWF2_39_15]